jgi:hypothetical protein
MVVYKIKTVPSEDTDSKSKKRLWLRVDDWRLQQILKELLLHFLYVYSR